MDPFVWHDGDRTIRFGRGLRAEMPELLGDGYALLTTERTAAQAPELADAAAERHEVPAGRVDEISRDLLADVGAARLVALGGGRVVDTAKAIAGVTGASVVAIPTSLSAAEMSWVHRRPAGHESEGGSVRPRLVLNDPALSGSQPPAALAASAANALGHAVESLASSRGNPATTAVAREAAERIAAARTREPLDDEARDGFALGALLAGWAMDATWYGLHHVMAQTLVRLAGAGHGPANAALLPHTLGALAETRPWLDPDGELAALARRLAVDAGAGDLTAIGVGEDVLEACADAAAQRPELRLTPPQADRERLLGLYRRAL